MYFGWRRSIRSADRVIHPAGDLHGGDSGNHRHNDFNNVEGIAPGLI
ncbi:hypothetical protein BANRA_00002 [Klebsiella pneumoniae]|nr:hypothetical protein BANRA_00002 [Klebsiella pneumoniae]